MSTPIRSYRRSASRPKKPLSFRPKKKPAWSRADAFDKLAQAYVEIERMGGMVFTLRLRRDVHDSLAASDDPTRLMSRRIQKEFKRRGLPVPLHAFCLEVTVDDRNEIHLHGAIVPGNLTLRQVKDVLRAAGGWIVGKAGSRQVQVKKFDVGRGGPVGWANYGKKALARTCRVIHHDRVTYIQAELRRVCEIQWERVRRPAEAMPCSLDGSIPS